MNTDAQGYVLSSLLGLQASTGDLDMPCGVAGSVFISVHPWFEQAWVAAPLLQSIRGSTAVPLLRRRQGGASGEKPNLGRGVFGPQVADGHTGSRQKRRSVAISDGPSVRHFPQLPCKTTLFVLWCVRKPKQSARVEAKKAPHRSQIRNIEKQGWAGWAGCDRGDEARRGIVLNISLILAQTEMGVRRRARNPISQSGRPCLESPSR
jgi:hypothetical protein